MADRFEVVAEPIFGELIQKVYQDGFQGHDAAVEPVTVWYHVFQCDDGTLVSGQYQASLLVVFGCRCEKHRFTGIYTRDLGQWI